MNRSDDLLAQMAAANPVRFSDLPGPLSLRAQRILVDAMTSTDRAGPESKAVILEFRSANRRDRWGREHEGPSDRSGVVPL